MTASRVRFSSPLARGRSGKEGIIWWLGGVFIGTAIVNMFALSGVEQSERAQLHYLNAIFSVYLYVECFLYIKKTDGIGLISPPLLASVLVFFLGFIGPITISIYDPWILTRFYLPNLWQQLRFALLIAMMAAFCMWRGYGLSQKAASYVRSWLAGRGVIRKRWRPELLRALVLQVIFILLVFIGISRGMFGIASSAESRLANVELLQFFTIALQGGSLSLLLICINHFMNIRRKQASFVSSLLCWCLIGLHVVVGALAGFKTQVMMPFLFLLLAYFLVNQTIQKRYAVMVLIALLAAYEIVQPYRAYLDRASLSGGTTVSILIDSLWTAQEEQSSFAASDIPFESEIAGRFDQTALTAVSLNAAQGSGVSRDMVDSMAQSVYLAPVLAFVPRIVWRDKPSNSYGGWFNRTVLGNIDDNVTSVGMGPIGFLYFIGGIFGVVLGFVIIGFIQAIVFDGIGRVGAGGLVIYLAGAWTLSTIPGDVGSSFAGLLQIVPIAVLAQFFLLRADAKSAVISSR